ncbi:unnamed protein product [Nippostrongylus brasiliensis]|uniref:Complex I-B17 n=1 Tax=Nippostrongylus brasiliensis TaxID=27835 RepID=A0A0N4YDC1_NIPBR|nr:unnamed protein product [Nippostrongylus brasiliensis]
MSGIVRQQVGIVKRQLRKTLQEAEGKHSDPNQAPKFKDDELLAAYEAHTEPSLQRSSTAAPLQQSSLKISPDRRASTRKKIITLTSKRSPRVVLSHTDLRK